MIRLGVIGWPVGHSRSPVMQNAALRHVGLGDSWRFQLLPVPPELFDETVLGLPSAGFRGVNVTIPHKSAALAVCTEASARASAIGAANTLLFEPDGRITADNTDAPALVDALRTRVDLTGCSALVLGAGGSARAAVWALLDAGAADVQIWNRTPERALELAAAVGGRAVISPDDFGDTDVLINCTSVGLSEGDELSALAFDAERLRRHRVIVDFVYRPGGTLFTLAAASVDVPHIDGMELLVGQGVLSFELFTGIPAPVEAMRTAVGLSSAP